MRKTVLKPEPCNVCPLVSYMRKKIGKQTFTPVEKAGVIIFVNETRGRPLSMSIYRGTINSGSRGYTIDREKQGNNVPYRISLFQQLLETAHKAGLSTLVIRGSHVTVRG